MKKLFALAFVLSSISIIPAQDTLRVLLLGNSLRSAWGSFASCAAERGMPVYLRQVGYHYSVQDGWTNATSDTTRDSIENGRWDYVALQCFGTAGLDYNPDSSIKYIRLWDHFIDSVGHGAQFVLYHVWPTTGYSPIWDTVNGVWKPDSLDKAMAILDSLCRELSVYILPVCAAQWEVQKRDKTIRTHTDWIHGSTEINYLGGMTMFCALTGQDPRGLGNYNGLPATVVHFLQQVAWSTVVKDDVRPLVLPWTWPALVNGLTLAAEGEVSSIEKYLTTPVTGNLAKTNSSVQLGSDWMLYRSLTPELMTINHLGIATALAPGTALIEAVAENVTDTLSLTVTASTAVYDSLRIMPNAFTSYVTDAFKFTATGYAFHQGQPLIVDFTEAATWISSHPAVFSVNQGRVFKHTAQGGPMWVAAEREGVSDTVFFTMAQDLPVLMRVNFQQDDTVFHPFWMPDWGQAYNDSMGYGWVATPYTVGSGKLDQWSDPDVFLTNSFVYAKTGPGYGDPAAEGTWRANIPDADYILKMGICRYSPWGTTTSWVIFGTDTLCKYTATQSQPVLIHKDTVIVREGQGMFLKIYGPIDYIVIATSAGVDIDSVAFDTPPLPPARTTVSVVSASEAVLMAAPNPLNASTSIHYEFPGKGAGTLAVHAIDGRLVRSFALKGGNGVAQWDGRDQQGRALASGLYLLRLKAGKNVLERKVLLAR